MAKIENKADAMKALKFDKKTNHTGGNKLTHKPSCYGIGLKWLIYARGMTYKQFANRLNGTTAQNLNYFINRVTKERFAEEDVGAMCKVLNVSLEYFETLCENIEELMEK